MEPAALIYRIQLEIHTNNLPVWLDGQSLQKVMQAGSADSATDADLQFGLFAADISRLEEMYSLFAALGFKRKEFLGHGGLFRVEMNHRQGVRMTFVLYRPVNQVFYSPALLAFSKKPYLSGKISVTIKELLKKSVLRLFSRIDTGGYPLKPLFPTGTLLIPQHYLQDFASLPTSPPVRAPKNSGQYLLARYPLAGHAGEDKFLKPAKPALVTRRQEYQSVTDILHRHQIPYCMDSGVLLGLMREGRVFSWEKDVDLQMHAEDAQKLLAIIPELAAKGWKVTRWYYKGLLYQFRIIRPGMIPVHIMLFRNSGDFAWCPAGRSLGNPYVGGIPRRFFGLFNKVRKILRDLFGATDVDRLPWRIRRQLATWWVPAGFFAEKIFHHDHQVYLPANWDDYLTFRYGNWRIPVTDWDFWTADGAICHLRPEELVDLKTYR